jgi:hypothetical protein
MFIEVDAMHPAEEITSSPSPIDRRVFACIYTLRTPIAIANSIAMVDARVLICAAIPTSMVKVEAISMSNSPDRILGVIELNRDNTIAGTKSWDDSCFSIKINQTETKFVLLYI